MGYYHNPSTPSVPFFFIPIGSLMGLTFSLPRENAYSWSEIMTMVTAIIMGLIHYIIIARFKRILFVHFYFMFVGCTLMCVAGFIISFGSISWSLIRPGDIDEIVFGAIIGGIGSSAVYISGLTYIHVRTSSYRYRLQKVGLCHLCLMLGLIAPVYEFGLDVDNADLRVFSKYMYFFSLANIGLLAGNELCQWRRVYDYKACREAELQAANEAGDEFEALVNRPRDRDGLPKQRQQQYLLEVLTIGSKFVFGFLFNRSLRIYATLAQLTLTSGFNSFFIKYLTVAFGTVFGLFVSTQLPTVKHYFRCALFGLVLSAVLAAVSLSLEALRAAAFFYLLMYLLFGVGLFVSDFAIMEVSSLKRHELYLSIGLVLEKIPIIISTYLGDHSNLTLLYVYTAQLALMGVLVAVLAKKYPGTLGRTQVQVQYLILYGLDTRPKEPIITKAELQKLSEEADREVVV